MTQRRAKRTFSEDQKKQLVALFNHGKPRSEIIREYDLTASAFDKWVKRINTTGSSHVLADVPGWNGEPLTLTVSRMILCDRDLPASIAEIHRTLSARQRFAQSALLIVEEAGEPDALESTWLPSVGER